MTRSQLSGFHTRRHISLNPHLEGCHLFHQPGTPHMTWAIDIYWQAALYQHLKTIIAKCFSTRYPCVCLINRERWRWRGVLYRALSHWRLLSTLERQYLIHAAGLVVQSATEVQECLRPKYGIFWCLPGINIRATYSQLVWNRSFLLRTPWKNVRERLRAEHWIITIIPKTVALFDVFVYYLLRNWKSIIVCAIKGRRENSF